MPKIPSLLVHSSQKSFDRSNVPYQSIRMKSFLRKCVSCQTSIMKTVNNVY